MKKLIISMAVLMIALCFCTAAWAQKGKECVSINNIPPECVGVGQPPIHLIYNNDPFPCTYLFEIEGMKPYNFEKEVILKNVTCGHFMYDRWCPASDVKEKAKKCLKSVVAQKDWDPEKVRYYVIGTIHNGKERFKIYLLLVDFMKLSVAEEVNRPTLKINIVRSKANPYVTTYKMNIENKEFEPSTKEIDVNHNKLSSVKGVERIGTESFCGHTTAFLNVYVKWKEGFQDDWKADWKVLEKMVDWVCQDCTIAPDIRIEY